MNTDTDATIRRIVADHGRLSVDPTGLDSTSDLYSLGLTSHATVNVMLALEEAFEIEFPDEMLRKDTFASLAAMDEVVGKLLGDRRIRDLAGSQGA